MVEQAQGVKIALTGADIQGDVLVHGVAVLRVVADGVLGTHTQAAALLVQVAGLFAEAEEVVLLPVHAGVVAQAAQLVHLKGPLRQVPVDALALGGVEGEGERLLFQHQLQGGGTEHQRLPRVLAGNVQRGDPGALAGKEGVQTVLPGGGHQGIGRFREFFLKRHPQADHIVAEEHQHRVRAVAVDQIAVRGLFDGLELFQNHGRSLPYMPIRSKSSKETVSVICIPFPLLLSCGWPMPAMPWLMSRPGLGYLTSTAFLVWL